MLTRLTPDGSVNHTWIRLMLIIHVVAPDFYGSIWHEDLTRKVLMMAGGWMMFGNLIMYRMVNLRI